jgi:hypothetical protein
LPYGDPAYNLIWIKMNLRRCIVRFGGDWIVSPNGIEEFLA